MPRKNTKIWHFPHVPVLIISTFYLFLIIKNKFFIHSPKNIPGTVTDSLGSQRAKKGRHQKIWIQSNVINALMNICKEATDPKPGGGTCGAGKMNGRCMGISWVMHLQGARRGCQAVWIQTGLSNQQCLYHKNAISIQF